LVKAKKLEEILKSQGHSKCSHATNMTERDVKMNKYFPKPTKAIGMGPEIDVKEYDPEIDFEKKYEG
jgi:hypothetical protein